jgi:hypothetical protein
LGIYAVKKSWVVRELFFALAVVGLAIVILEDFPKAHLIMHILELMGVLLAILCGVVLFKDPLGTVKTIVGDKMFKKYMDLDRDTHSSD